MKNVKNLYRDQILHDDHPVKDKVCPVNEVPGTATACIAQRSAYVLTRFFHRSCRFLLNSHDGTSLQDLLNCHWQDLQRLTGPQSAGDNSGIIKDYRMALACILF